MWLQACLSCLEHQGFPRCFSLVWDSTQRKMGTGGNWERCYELVLNVEVLEWEIHLSCPGACVRTGCSGMKLDRKTTRNSSLSSFKGVLQHTQERVALGYICTINLFKEQPLWWQIHGIWNKTGVEVQAISEVRITPWVFFLKSCGAVVWSLRQNLNCWKTQNYSTCAFLRTGEWQCELTSQVSKFLVWP